MTPRYWHARIVYLNAYHTQIRSDRGLAKMRSRFFLKSLVRNQKDKVVTNHWPLLGCDFLAYLESAKALVST